MGEMRDKQVEIMGGRAGVRWQQVDFFAEKIHTPEYSLIISEGIAARRFLVSMVFCFSYFRAIFTVACTPVPRRVTGEDQ